MTQCEFHRENKRHNYHNNMLFLYVFIHFYCFIFNIYSISQLYKISFVQNNYRPDLKSKSKLFIIYKHNHLNSELELLSGLLFPKKNVWIEKWTIHRYWHNLQESENQANEIQIQQINILYFISG